MGQKRKGGNKKWRNFIFEMAKQNDDFLFHVNALYGA